jgi:hypothetical protein
MHTWQEIFLAVLTAAATFTSLSGTTVAQSGKFGMIDATKQKVQTTPANSAQEKLDHS